MREVVYLDCSGVDLFLPCEDMDTEIPLRQALHILYLYQDCQDHCSSHSHRFYPIPSSPQCYFLSIVQVLSSSVPLDHWAFGSEDNSEIPTLYFGCLIIASKSIYIHKSNKSNLFCCDTMLKFVKK